MAGLTALDMEKLQKSKRGYDREGSPKLDDRYRKDDRKRMRKDGDDSESGQKEVDILEEVVDTGHHTISNKDKDKSVQLPGGLLGAAGLMRDPKGMSLPAAAVHQQMGEVFTYATVAPVDESMVSGSAYPTGLELAGSRGWTEPVKEQKKTHFSSKETEILRNAIVDYCKRIGYKEDNISEFLFSKKRDLNTGRDGIWPEIAKCLPHRSVASIYYHAKRKFRQLTRGEWNDVDVEELRKLVQQHGTKWEKIGVALNRTSHSCRDKWRDLSVPLMPTSGKWSKEEDKRLREAVLEVHNNVIPESGILWSQVAEKMKETGRARSQCRFRWESLKKGFDGEDVKQFWSQTDCLLLLQRIQESGVEDETEIV